MVTSFYIMKMSKGKKNYDIYNYLDNLYNMPISKELLLDKSNSKCKVCLQSGTVSIFDEPNAFEIIESIQIFGNIELNENDTCRKYLCDMCHRFIKSAIMFRKIAKRTNALLKQHINTLVNHFNNDCNQKFNDTDKDTETYLNDQSEMDLNENNGKEKSKRTNCIPCQICKKLIQKSYYKIHLTIHNPDKNKYVCDICGKTFRLGPGYYNHRLRHRTDYPFKCELCPFKGKYLDRLKSHMQSHSGEYRYMCTECPARFIFKSNFNRHVLLKHSEPQHKCVVCEKAFHTKIELQRHTDVEHLGLKNHICNICGKAFGYKSAMHKHQRRLHKRENLRFHFKPPSTDKN